MGLDKDHFDEIAENNECLLADGFEDCVLGMMYAFGKPPVVAYDYDKVIKKLMSQGMSYESAVEYWDYNMVGAWVGETTPVYIETIDEE